MSSEIFTSVVAVATAIVGIAIIAVLVSKNSETVNVIKTAGDAFAQDLKVVVSPVQVVPSIFTGTNGALSSGSSGGSGVLDSVLNNIGGFANIGSSIASNSDGILSKIGSFFDF